MSLTEQLDERLDALIARPGMFGGRFAAERQALQLLQVRFLTADDSRTWVDVHWITKEYRRFIRDRRSSPTVHSIEKAVPEEQFSAALRDFVAGILDTPAVG